MQKSKKYTHKLTPPFSCQPLLFPCWKGENVNVYQCTFLNTWYFFANIKAYKSTSDCVIFVSKSVKVCLFSENHNFFTLLLRSSMCFGELCVKYGQEWWVCGPDWPYASLLCKPSWTAGRSGRQFRWKSFQNLDWLREHFYHMVDWACMNGVLYWLRVNAWI